MRQCPDGAQYFLVLRKEIAGMPVKTQRDLLSGKTYLAPDSITQILSIKGIRIECENQELPKNPYHPNPLREYDHQITEAGMIGYGEAQLDMKQAGFVKCERRE